MDREILETYDASLRRCSARPGFLDRFYLRFTASSPKVREKFAETDFVRQKVALRASLHVMTLAVADGGPDEDRGSRKSSFSPIGDGSSSEVPANFHQVTVYRVQNLKCKMFACSV